MPPTFPPPCAPDDLGSRPAELALVGRAMLAGLEHIADPEARAAALRAALVDNPVSAQPLWAAVEAWGGVRRPGSGPVLVTHLATAEALLARDAEAATGGGPSALLAAHTGRPSHFLRAPDRFLATRPASAVLAETERSALAYLESRAGGRDVHVPMLVDTVLAGLLGTWLGVEERARATRLLGLAGTVAQRVLDPWPEQGAALGPQIDELLGALGRGPVTRLESYWLGALATHDRVAARAAAIDSLTTLAGPVALGLRSALERALGAGLIAGSWAEGGSSESGTRRALPSFCGIAGCGTAGPALLGLWAEGGAHPAIERGERVLIALGHVERSARACGREAALPWLAQGALMPVCGGAFDGVLRALARCQQLESRGARGFRFAEITPRPSGQPPRPWPLRWWR